MGETELLRNVTTIKVKDREGCCGDGAPGTDVEGGEEQMWGRERQRS